MRSHYHFLLNPLFHPRASPSKPVIPSCHQAIKPSDHPVARQRKKDRIITCRSRRELYRPRPVQPDRHRQASTVARRPRFPGCNVACPGVPGDGSHRDNRNMRDTLRALHDAVGRLFSLFIHRLALRLPLPVVLCAVLLLFPGTGRYRELGRRMGDRDRVVLGDGSRFWTEIRQSLTCDFRAAMEIDGTEIWADTSPTASSAARYDNITIWPSK